MQRDQILNAIRGFIIEQTNLEDASFLDADTNLFEAGLLDSLLTVSLVAFFESDLGCEVETTDMTEENFSTIGAITDLVCRKLAAKEG
ncbi:MAG: D-alanine--poly(phosphoribitol) ligase subunit 2 [Syntrophus sp. PtaB.Bin138]|nr:MAG: D-alanine--poly(phosphoribitol) ligase subunit 2 [Syntrophus sp. PtaB.Bin138]